MRLVIICKPLRCEDLLLFSVEYCFKLNGFGLWTVCRTKQTIKRCFIGRQEIVMGIFLHNLPTGWRPESSRSLQSHYGSSSGPSAATTRNERLIEFDRFGKRDECILWNIPELRGDGGMCVLSGDQTKPKRFLTAAITGSFSQEVGPCPDVFVAAELGILSRTMTFPSP